jgi:hypothetical protein
MLNQKDEIENIFRNEALAECSAAEKVEDYVKSLQAKLDIAVQALNYYSMIKERSEYAREALAKIGGGDE